MITNGSRPPIVLSDELSFTFDPAIGTAPAKSYDLQRLTNTYRVPIEIREIRWSTYSFLAAETPFLDRSFFAPIFEAQIGVGQRILTRDYTNITLLGRSYGQRTSVGPSEEIEQNGRYSDTKKDAGANHLRWVFPRPMILRPGDCLRTYVRVKFPPALVGAADSAPFTSASCSIAAVGRFFTGPLPRVTSIPYVSAFLADNSTRLTSLPEEFYNPFDSPLHVQRFLARAFRIIDLGVPTDIYRPGLGRNCNVKWRAPYGYEVFPTVLPVSELITPQSRMWTVPHVLADRESWHQFTFDTITARGPDVTPPPTIGISMVGHREERL